MEITKAVCFSGPRTERLPQTEEGLRRRVIGQDDPRKIHVVAAIPFTEQAARWNEADRDRYFDVLKQCDEAITLSAHYHGGCYYERNHR